MLVESRDEKQQLKISMFNKHSSGIQVVSWLSNSGAQIKSKNGDKIIGKEFYDDHYFKITLCFTQKI